MHLLVSAQKDDVDGDSIIYQHPFESVSSDNFLDHQGITVGVGIYLIMFLTPIFPSKSAISCVVLLSTVLPTLSVSV